MHVCHRWVVFSPPVRGHRGLGARAGRSRHACPGRQERLQQLLSPNSFSLPGTGSTTAQQLLASAIPAQAGDSDTIVWQVSHGTVRDATVTVRMSGILKQIATMPEVAAVASPY